MLCSAGLLDRRCARIGIGRSFLLAIGLRPPIFLLICASCLLALPSFAQTPPATLPAAEKPKVEDAATAPEDYSLHFQGTMVSQGHPGFHAPYAGPRSLASFAEIRNSYTTTLFLGARLWKGAEVYADPEMSAGEGIGQLVGIAGYPNGDVARVLNSAPGVYLARGYFRQIIGFGGETETVPADQNQLAATYDISRLTLTAGKFSAADQFDNNAYSHDPRAQFLNWALMSNGAWDYPADVRGYTLGATAELNQPRWAVRYGIFMEPAEASGGPLDYHIGRAFGQAAEYEQRYQIANKPGKLRLLAFLNHAHMGSYTDAAMLVPPDITRTRRYSVKYGFGINLEQQLTGDLGLFARIGWNNGRREDWAFTEIDRTASVGLSLKGTRWSRPDDTVGLAGVLNGLSDEHRRYLSNGGVGFIIGDGKLTYDLEEIAETYYSAKLFKIFYLTGDLQFVNHPAYNRDRGPVVVGAIRLHVQF
jgi:high affinity Mn2+ porin